MDTHTDSPSFIIQIWLSFLSGVMPQGGVEDRHLAVKQSYPFKTNCMQDCEASRKSYIQGEASRIMTADGTVIKNMTDGSVEVRKRFLLAGTIEAIDRKLCLDMHHNLVIMIVKMMFKVM